MKQQNEEFVWFRFVQWMNGRDVSKALNREVISAIERNKQKNNFVDFPEHIQCKPLICRFLHAQSGECRTALVLENSTYNAKYSDGHFSCTASYNFQSDLDDRKYIEFVCSPCLIHRVQFFREWVLVIMNFSVCVCVCVCLHSVCTRLFTISYFNEHRVHIHFRLDDTEELRPRHSHSINTIWLACWLQKRQYRHCSFSEIRTEGAHSFNCTQPLHTKKVNKIINWKRRNTVDCNLIINNKNRM